MKKGRTYASKILVFMLALALILTPLAGLAEDLATTEPEAATEAPAEATAKTPVAEKAAGDKVVIGSSTSVTLDVGEASQITAYVTNAGGAVQSGHSLSYLSNGENVASVDANGKITAVGAGSATITVSSSDTNTTSATVSVTVRPVASSIVITGESTMNVNQTATFSAVVYPTSTTQKVTWSVSNDAAVINSSTDTSINLTVVQPVDFTVTATAGGISQTYSVTVTKGVEPTSIAFSASSVNGELYANSSANISLTLVPTPSNAYIDPAKLTLTYSVSGIVSYVEKVGNVLKYQGSAAGYTTVTATYEGLTSTSCTVGVYPNPTGIIINPSSASVTVGGTKTFAATVYPAATSSTPAAKQTVTWSMTYENGDAVPSSVATINADTGLLTILSATTRTIRVYAKTSYGGSVNAEGYATVTVSYANAPTALTVVNSTITLYEEQTYTLASGSSSDYVVSPSSADPSIGAVSANSNYVTAASTNGVVTLTAQSDIATTGMVSTTVSIYSTANPSLTGLITVNIYACPENLSDVVAYKGTTNTLNPAVIPAGAYQTLVWTNAYVASVDAGNTSDFALTTSGVLTVPSDTTAATLTIKGIRTTYSPALSALYGGNGLTLTVSLRDTTNRPSSISLKHNDSDLISVIGARANRFYIASDNWAEVEDNKVIATIMNSGDVAIADLDVKWTIADTSVATLSGAGIDNGKPYVHIKGLKEGVTTLTATTLDGTALAVSFPIQVTYATATKIEFASATTGFTVAPSTKNNWTAGDLYVDSTARVSYSVIAGDINTPTANPVPVYAADQSVTVTPVDSSYVTVTKGSSYFNLKGVKAGSTDVYVFTSNVDPQKITVTIKNDKTTSVSIAQGSQIGLGIGESTTLNVAFSPTSSAYSVQFVSQNTAVATASGNIVFGVSAGTTTIYVKDLNGNYVNTDGTTSSAIGTSPLKFTVIVYNKSSNQPTSIALNATSFSMTVGNTATASVTATPSSAYAYVTWTSSNTDVVTFSDGSSDGKYFGASATLKATGSGTATITATSANGVTASATVTVTYAEAQTVTITPANPTMDVAATLQLYATVYPTGADQNVTWASLNTSIATVDSKGLVTSLAAGEVYITATTSTNGTRIGMIKVTVTPIAVTSVEFIDVPDVFVVGETIDLKAKVYPANANQTVDWTISPSIANSYYFVGNTYGDTSIRGLLAGGTLTVTATARGSRNTDVSGSANYVTKTISIKDAVSSITLSKTSITDVYKNNTTALVATILPSSAVQDVEWSTSNAKVALVDSNGVVRIMGGGTATITATAYGGKTATCEVTALWRDLTGISLKPQNGTVEVAGKLALEVVTTPDGANPAATFVSSDPTIATVDEEGIVRGIKTGTVTIKATSTVNADYTAETTITVIEASIKIIPDQTEVEIKVGQQIELMVTTEPASAAIDGFLWSVDDTSVLKGAKTNGNIRGLEAGETYVTVRLATNTSVSARIKVTVVGLQTGMRVYTSSAAYLEAGTAGTLSTTTPAKLVKGVERIVYVRVMPKGLNDVQAQFDFVICDKDGNELDEIPAGFMAMKKGPYSPHLKLKSDVEGSVYVKVYSVKKPQLSKIIEFKTVAK